MQLKGANLESIDVNAFVDRMAFLSLDKEQFEKGISDYWSGLQY